MKGEIRVFSTPQPRSVWTARAGQTVPPRQSLTRPSGHDSGGHHGLCGSRSPSALIPRHPMMGFPGPGVMPSFEHRYRQTDQSGTIRGRMARLIKLRWHPRHTQGGEDG